MLVTSTPAALTPAPQPEAQVRDAGRDIGILLAQIDWLQECTGETLEAEDAALVYRIRRDWSGVAPDAPKPEATENYADGVNWVHGDDYASAVRERDEALARVAAAFVASAKLPTTPEWRWRFEPCWSASDMATAIRALTPADATAALDWQLAEARAQGMREAAKVTMLYIRDLGCSEDTETAEANRTLKTVADAILARAAEIEKDADQ